MPQQHNRFTTKLKASGLDLGRISRHDRADAPRGIEASDKTMPIYEFYCPDNHRIYSFYARSSTLGGKLPRCPDSPDYRLIKEFSAFSVTRRYEGGGGPEAGDHDIADDPKVVAAMVQLEREMAGMDEQIPDPRQIAVMMRRMAAITGEGLPPALAEMIGRMEKGDDPDQLEEEYGDLLDDALSDDAEAIETPQGVRLRTMLRRRPPTRDPVLYEMSDFL